MQLHLTGVMLYNQKIDDMIIRQIQVKNFRLLKDFVMDLHQSYLLLQVK